MRGRFNIATGTVAAVGILACTPARGELVEIRGGTSATVIQWVNGVQTQSDFAQETVPTTAAVPPAISRARLESLDDNGETTAGGDVVTVFETPSLLGIGPPNDLGLDLGAFSDDDETSWFVEGTANEVRTIVLQDTDTTGNLLFGGISRGARSEITLSGVMLIASLDPMKDLSGVDAGFLLKLEQRRTGLFSPPPQTLIEGQIELVGGPNGSVEISNATGPFATMFLPILDFAVPDALPLVRAVQFAGTTIPFDYDFADGEEFELELSIEARIHTIPDGSAAGIVFGMPPDGLASVLERVKKDDSGQRLADVINQHVDTTGAAYANGGGGPLAFLSPMCGASVVEAMIGFGVGICVLSRGTRRKRGKPSSRCDARPGPTAR